MPNNRRRMTGQVVSNKMDKTVVVQVEHTARHPLYGKVIRTHTRYMAHDEGNECEIGDEVVLVEARPMSKKKRWAVQEILREDLSARTVEVADLAAVDEADVLGEVSPEDDNEADVEEVVEETE